MKFVMEELEETILKIMWIHEQNPNCDRNTKSKEKYWDIHKYFISNYIQNNNNKIRMVLAPK